jgi:hypothetical protein
MLLLIYVDVGDGQTWASLSNGLFPFVSHYLRDFGRPLNRADNTI